MIFGPRKLKTNHSFKLVLSQLVAPKTDLNLPEIYLVDQTHRDEAMSLATGILSKLS